MIYAGDPQAASRFFMDQSALESGEEPEERGGEPAAPGPGHAENLGLTDQARVNGGLEGLLHTLRAGQAVLELCDEMDQACPEALVINLGQPVARTTEIFLDRGYRCFGIGRTPLKGANGLDTLTKRLQGKPEENLDWEIAGLPGFSFLMKLEDRESGKDWMPRLKKAAKERGAGPADEKMAGLVGRAGGGGRDGSRGVSAGAAGLHSRGEAGVRRDRGAAEGTDPVYEHGAAAGGGGRGRRHGPAAAAVQGAAGAAHEPGAGPSAEGGRGAAGGGPPERGEILPSCPGRPWWKRPAEAGGGRTGPRESG